MKDIAKILDLFYIKGRIICIGDIHSQYDALMNLLKKVQYDEKTDYLIACGDLIDRGVQPKEVLGFFMPDNPQEDNKRYSVCGNHDFKLMRYLHGAKIKAGEALKQTIDILEYQCNPIELAVIGLFLKGLPNIIRLPDLKGKPLYLTHAGVDAKYPIDQQKIQTTLFVRGINPKNYFDESQGVWYDFLDGSYRVVSGHIVSPIVQPNDNVFCLDNGACHGGSLRAMIIEKDNFEIIEINCAQTPGKTISNS